MPCTCNKVLPPTSQHAQRDAAQCTACCSTDPHHVLVTAAARWSPGVSCFRPMFFHFSVCGMDRWLAQVLVVNDEEGDMSMAVVPDEEDVAK